tara:strand:- start:93 stop:899 length:807 start_codon:yes stop_codon:yes gene_type:complete
MSKIIDCVTFFQENFILNLRYNIINKYIDYMIVCESRYDHRGNKKDLNFDFKKNYNKEKLKYIILDKPFPKNNSIWNNQAIQREFILENLNFAGNDDYIMFSDPDEIPNPKTLINFKLKKKYGIFLQNCFNYKLNLFNPYESPWEGTRVCKKKNLKSIDYMRQKIKSKNLNYSFYRIDKEKNIDLFQNAGWHFNNILSPEKISLKLKTFAHSEYSDEKYSSPKVIRKKIEEKIDLFDRGHHYKKIEIDDTYPKFILENLNEFSEFILK